MSSFFLKCCCNFDRTSCRPIFSVITLTLTTWTLALLSSNFVTHSYDYRMNWTPPSHTTIINKTQEQTNLSAGGSNLAIK